MLLATAAKYCLTRDFITMMAQTWIILIASLWVFSLHKIMGNEHFSGGQEHHALVNLETYDYQNSMICYFLHMALPRSLIPQGLSFYRQRGCCLSQGSPES